MLAFNLCVEFTSQAVWTKPKENIAIVIPENLRHGKPGCYEPDQTNWSCSLFWGLARQFGPPADTLFDFCKNLLTVGLLFGSVDSEMYMLCSKNQHVCSFSQSVAFDSQIENQDHWRSIGYQNQLKVFFMYFVFVDLVSFAMGCLWFPNRGPAPFARHADTLQHILGSSDLLYLYSYLYCNCSSWNSCPEVADSDCCSS